MQRIFLTIDNSKNAFVLLNLIKQFDFVKSIEFEKNIFSENDEEIFNESFLDDFYLDDFQMTVKELRLQTLKDEKEKGMSKEEFFNSMKKWRTTN